VEHGKLRFAFHDDAASSAAVAGTFNGWDPARLPMKREEDGSWHAEMPVPTPGRYRYKLVLDESRWLADPSHGWREEDPYGGFDSLLEVGNGV
jgi:1,4-alpha-glucan branching enzyme